ncbi:MAG: lysostaphin resistance A-like protein [Actinomycetes bacterium]
MTSTSSGPSGPWSWVVAHRDLLALGLLVLTLTTWNLTRDPVVPDDYHLTANVVLTAAVLAVGRAGALRADDLGLRRDRLGPGAAWGSAAVLLVLVVLVVGVLVAPSAFRDDQVDVGTRTMLFQVLVQIPLATVMFEEVAFRGVLLGLLRRRLPTWPAVAVSAVLFGLWHVDGVVQRHGGPGLAAAVVGTLAATTVAGVGFAWLRVRSDSLVAPMLAHWATNSLAFVVAWVRWH